MLLPGPEGELGGDAGLAAEGALAGEAAEGDEGALGADAACALLNWVKIGLQYTAPTARPSRASAARRVSVVFEPLIRLSPQVSMLAR